MSSKSNDSILRPGNNRPEKGLLLATSHIKVDTDKMLPGLLAKANPLHTVHRGPTLPRTMFPNSRIQVHPIKDHDFMVILPIPRAFLLDHILKLPISSPAVMNIAQGKNLLPSNSMETM
jgi:hypothetical protein